MTPTDLIRNMGHALRDGFEPQGGIAEAGDEFMQAAVKYEYISEMEYSRRLMAAQEASGYGRYR